MQSESLQHRRTWGSSAQLGGLPAGQLHVPVAPRGKAVRTVRPCTSKLELRGSFMVVGRHVIIAPRTALSGQAGPTDSDVDTARATPGATTARRLPSTISLPT